MIRRWNRRRIQLEGLLIPKRKWQSEGEIITAAKNKRGKGLTLKGDDFKCGLHDCSFVDCSFTVLYGKSIHAWLYKNIHESVAEGTCTRKQQLPGDPRWV